MKLTILISTLFLSSLLFASSTVPKKPMAKKGAQQTRIITIVNYEIDGVKQWNPGFLMAKKGEKVTLKLINKAKGIHGFYIPAFNIKENLKKDETKNIDFVASKAGLFDVKCHLHGAHVGGQLYIIE